MDDLARIGSRVESKVKFALLERFVTA